ncbi:hypothetical protein GGS24DRAFT_496470 [Hypoxylon argillaceum]|nr:hypothetical protein GGS24DRAFT_496470 [Hypoxylon argillaceum]
MTLHRDATVEPSSDSKRFECDVPNCNKFFRRKEHLTRHLKSHDAQLQYACHICGRRYARSDVLKRHVEFHPQYYKTKRNFVACARCRENKTRCDEDNPCKHCSRRGLPCVRANSGSASVNTENEVLESSRSLSSPSPSPIHTPEESKLGEYVLRDPPATQRRLVIYYNEIHPSWPILQPSMVMTTRSPALLIASIMMLASWLEGDLEHLELFPLVLEEIAERQLDPNPPLPVLQAMALCVLYCTCYLSIEGMAFKALRLHNTLVTACRFSGIFASQRGLFYSSSPISPEEKVQEGRHRLAFAVLRLDAYLSTLIDFPPLIRYQELSVPVSQSTCWISVDSEEERCKLLEDESLLRKKTPFSFRVHDLFGAPRSNSLASPWTKMDYHFILCAIQSGAWEACHQALRTVSDDMHSKTHDQDLRTIWRDYLSNWMLRNEYFTVSRGDDIAPQTLLLWHMTALKLQAPPEFLKLQEHYYQFRPAGAPSGQSPQNSLRPWQASKIGRTAVWHSAQIARIVSSEFELGDASTRLRLNPLLIPALLLSATVVCGYARHTRGCPLCTGSGPVDLVHIFGATDDCERLDHWLEEGVGLPNWGMHVFTGFPVCHCRMVILYEWFREFLARDKKADAALVAFLDQLKTGVW